MDAEGCENLWIEIISPYKTKRCIIAAVYRHSFCNLKSLNEELCATLQKIALDNYIICGDLI